MSKLDAEIVVHKNYSSTGPLIPNIVILQSWLKNLVSITLVADSPSVSYGNCCILT